MPHSLSLDGVGFSVGSRPILRNITFTLSPTDRTGLIGENGSGKSTLLRLIAGELTPSSGVIRTSGQRIGLLHQELDAAPGQTVRRVLDAAAAPAHRCLKRLDCAAAELSERPEDPSLLRSYAASLEEADALQTWEIGARVAAAQEGLRLPSGATVDSLSGGQRARLALARLILSAPEVLLLDEPTNHLDHRATAYLQDVVAGWPGPVLIASHDRAFLDESVTALIDLDPAPSVHQLHEAGKAEGAQIFHGTYGTYLRHRAAQRTRWAEQYRQEQEQLARLRTAVEKNHRVGNKHWNSRSETRAATKFYADRNAAAVSRRVAEARTKLRALEEAQIRKPPAKLSFRGVRRPSRSWSGPVLVADSVTVPGRLPATSLSIRGGEKWLVTGDNGAGKSTLLRLLSGDLSPAAGGLWRPHALRVDALGQHPAIAHTEGSAADFYTRSVGTRAAPTSSCSTNPPITSRRTWWSSSRPPCATSPAP